MNYDWLCIVKGLNVKSHCVEFLLLLVSELRFESLVYEGNSL